MDTLIAASRRTATRTLSLIMGAAAVSWVLFVVGQYIGLVNSAGSMWGHGQPEQVRTADYVTLAAIIVLGLGALVAKRILAPLRASTEPRSRLVHSVSLLASLMLIISAVLASWTVFMTFMNGLNVDSDAVDPLVRTMNLYLPIVAYTVLVVGIILAGFVFVPAPSKHQVHTSNAPYSPEVSSSEIPQETAPAVSTNEHGPKPRAKALTGRLTAGIAYAVPIVAIALALILGLIIYDFTRTSLQGWIWVAIFVIVGTGVFAGTVFASRSLESSDLSAPVVRGARHLNFVLTVVFTFVVTSMALGNATSAVYQLNVSPSLSLTTFNFPDNHAKSVEPVVGSPMTIDPALSLWGSDLKRDSEVVVVIEPGGQEVMRARVGHDRWVSSEEEWPEGLTPGEYTFIARAEAADGAPLEISIPVTVKEDGEPEFPAGGDAYSGDEKSRLLPISASWLLSDLLPAGVLLALGIFLVSTTITVRNPDRLTAK
ncbi:MAG: hypothetical protein QM705_12360 [Ancrocorticia sp.]